MSAFLRGMDTKYLHFTGKVNAVNECPHIKVRVRLYVCVSVHVNVSPQVKGSVTRK